MFGIRKAIRRFFTRLLTKSMLERSRRDPYEPPEMSTELRYACIRDVISETIRDPAGKHNHIYLGLAKSDQIAPLLMASQPETAERRKVELFDAAIDVLLTQRPPMELYFLENQFRILVSRGEVDLDVQLLAEMFQISL